MDRPAKGQPIVRAATLEEVRPIRESGGSVVFRDFDLFATHVAVQVGDEMVGAASYVEDLQGVFVYGVVATTPGHGVARRTLDYVSAVTKRPVLLHATESNVALYTRLGFTDIGSRPSLLGPHDVRQMVRQPGPLALDSHRAPSLSLRRGL